MTGDLERLVEVAKEKERLQSEIEIAREVQNQLFPKSLPAAKKGYEKLNKAALSLIKDDGYLVTSSCSFHLKKEEFIEIVNSAALKAGKSIQLIHYYGASLDHPSLPSMEETSYLKFAVLKVKSL
jgi:23S rRNA (cytosine1962-C5)-methyltransferase